MFKKILDKILEYKTIIIHRHIRPDGDCIGSQFGLKSFIEENFKDKKVYAVGDEVPNYLKSCGESDFISDDIYINALVIVVDTATKDRICDKRYIKGKFIIKIDHHDDSFDYADLNYVDPKTPACSAILTRMFINYEKEGYKIPTHTAKCLYTGIVTDTGRFRFRGVNGEVLRSAAYLLDLGIDTEYIYPRLYMKKKETLKLEGFVYNHFKITENGVVYIYFTKSIMEKFNVTKDDAANLVNCLDSIENSLIWVAFIDQMLPPEENPKNLNELKEKEIRVRIRSRFVSINDVASKYRGGGHLQAAGATVYSKKEIKTLLKDLDDLLFSYKQNHPEVF